MASQFETLADINLKMEDIKTKFVLMSPQISKWIEELSILDSQLNSLNEIKDPKKKSIQELKDIQTEMKSHLNIDQFEQELETEKNHSKQFEQTSIDLKSEIDALTFELNKEKDTTSKLEQSLAETEEENSKLKERQQESDVSMTSLKKLYAKSLEENQLLANQLEKHSASNIEKQENEIKELNKVVSILKKENNELEDLLEKCKSYLLANHYVKSYYDDNKINRIIRNYINYY